jgi:hypothetical protein
MRRGFVSVSLGGYINKRLRQIREQLKNRR